MTPDLKRLCEAAKEAHAPLKHEYQDCVTEWIVRAVLVALKEVGEDAADAGATTECLAPSSSGPLRENEPYPIGPIAASEAFIAMIDHILSDPVP